MGAVERSMNAGTAKLLCLDKAEVIHRFEKRVGHEAAVSGWRREVAMGAMMFWTGIIGIVVAYAGWAATGDIVVIQIVVPLMLVSEVLAMSLRVYYEGKFFREASIALGFKVTRKDPLTPIIHTAA